MKFRPNPDHPDYLLPIDGEARDLTASWESRDRAYLHGLVNREKGVTDLGQSVLKQLGAQVLRTIEGIYEDL